MCNYFINLFMHVLTVPFQPLVNEHGSKKEAFNARFLYVLNSAWMYTVNEIIVSIVLNHFGSTVLWWWLGELQSSPAHCCTYGLWQTQVCWLPSAFLCSNFTHTEHASLNYTCRYRTPFSSYVCLLVVAKEQLPVDLICKVRINEVVCCMHGISSSACLKLLGGMFVYGQ